MKDKTLRREAFIAAILGALLALFFLLFTRLEWLGEEPYIATHVVLGHGYLNPYNPAADAKPTAISPPFYPYLVAGVYEVFGLESHMAFGVLYAINIVCVALTAAGVYVLAYWLFGKMAARWSILLFLLYPAFGRNAASLWDTLPSLAGFIWIVVWCKHMQRTRSATPGRIFALGIALGLLALAHLTPVLTYPFLITMAVGKTTFGNWFKMSAISFIAFVLMLIPWQIRDYHVFGRFFIVRDNFPLEMYVGNQPGTYGSHVMWGHPATDPVERERMNSEGENKYFDELWQRFLVEYHADPGAYWRHTLNRLGFLYVDSLPEHRFRAVRICVESVFVVLAVAGLVIGWRLGYRASWLFWLCLLSVIPYMFTEVTLSYTLPLRAGLMVYGGFAVAVLMSYLQKGKLPETPHEKELVPENAVTS